MQKRNKTLNSIIIMHSHFVITVCSILNGVYKFGECTYPLVYLKVGATRRGLVPCQCDPFCLYTNTVNCCLSLCVCVCVRYRVKIMHLFGHHYSRCNWRLSFRTNYKNEGSFYKCPRYEILCHISVQKRRFLRSLSQSSPLLWN
jgi:hypothetical protein